MSELRVALAALIELADMLPKMHTQPTEAHRPTHKAMLLVTGGRDMAPAPPSLARLERVWRTIQQVRASGGDYAKLHTGDLRHAVWLLWDRSARVAQITNLFHLLLQRAEKRSNVLRTLINAWLVGFDPNDPTIVEAGQAIERSLMRHNQSTIIHWRQQHEELHLFHATEGPERFAMALMNGDTQQVLNMGGFGQPLRAASGYLRTVMRAYGRRLPDRLTGQHSQAQLEAAKVFFTLGDRLRFDEPQMLGVVADALVGPWHAGNGPDDLRTDVLAFLRQHLGDLRIKPERWDDCSHQTRNIVRAWLAALTLSAFFDVIGQFAARAGNDDTWQARKRFWTACLNNGWISDSWLALGGNVHANIATNRQLRDSYARLEQVKSPNHSALLMQIGSLVFVEWSHNGKLYAWEAGSKVAPRLAPKSRYTEGDLQAPCLRFPAPDGRLDLAPTGTDGLVHSRGVWQGRVAALLRIHEGMRLTQDDWN